jgi:hypothetical protein
LLKVAKRLLVYVIAGLFVLRYFSPWGAGWAGLRLQGLLAVLAWLCCLALGVARPGYPVRIPHLLGFIVWVVLVGVGVWQCVVVAGTTVPWRVLAPVYALLCVMLALGTALPLRVLLQAWDRRESVRLLLAFLQVLFLINGAVGVLQFALWSVGWQDAYWLLNPGRYATFFLDGQGEYDMHRVRASGLTTGANALGCLAGMLWPLVPRWGFPLALLLVGLTGSRALALAVICQLVAWAVLRRRPGLSVGAIPWRVVTVTALLAVAGGLLMLGLPGRPPLVEIQDIRTSIWSMTLKLWPQWWLVGLPPGAMDNLVNVGSFDVINPTATARLHSTVLDLLVNHGLLGVALMAMHLGLGWRELLRRGRRHGDFVARGVLLGLVGAGVTMATEDQGVSQMLMGTLLALLVLGGLVSAGKGARQLTVKSALILGLLGLWVALRLAVTPPSPLEVWTRRAQDHALNQLPPGGSGWLAIRMGRPAPGHDPMRTWTAAITDGRLEPWQAAVSFGSGMAKASGLTTTALDAVVGMEDAREAAIMLARLRSRDIGDLRSLARREEGTLSIPLPRRMALYRGLNEAAVIVQRDRDWSLVLAGEGPHGTYGGVIRFERRDSADFVVRLRRGAFLLTSGLACLALDAVP